MHDSYTKYACGIITNTGPSWSCVPTPWSRFTDLCVLVASYLLLALKLYLIWRTLT